MTTTTAGLSDLWAKAWDDEDFRFQIKAQDVSVTLARTLADSGMTKAALAASLGWKPSRVSRVLSGAGNLTLRTVFDLTAALGLDFDLILRRPNQPA